MMSNRFFNVKNPKQTVTIIGDQDKFYELSDGNMIKKDTFMQKYQPVIEGYEANELETNIQNTTNQGNPGVLDPESFFNSTSLPSDVINGFKEADTSKITDFVDNNRSTVNYNNTEQMTKKTPNMNESLVKPMERQEIPNNTNTDVSQYKVYDDDDEAYNDFIKNNNIEKPEQEKPKPQMTDIDKQKQQIEVLFLDEKEAFGEQEAITRRSKRLLKIKEQSTPSPVQSELSSIQHSQTEHPEQLSAIEMMFSTFKRKHDISINVEFKDKIGEPDFIKMMVENMDGDIVGYYKKLIMKNIMGNLSKIEEAVERTIHFEIFGEELSEEKTINNNLYTVTDIKEDEKSKNINNIESPVNDNVTFDGVELIPGGTTKSGKQKYKFIDDKGKVKELLFNTAKGKGYKPLLKEE